MTNTRKLISKLAVAVGLIGSLAFSAATPSLAAGSQYYEPGDNSSVWSNYPGYTDEITAPRRTDQSSAYHAYARAPISGRGGARADNPAGSAFQTRGNNDSMGCPC
jgi:hypothetical protein